MKMSNIGLKKVIVACTFGLLTPVAATAQPATSRDVSSTGADRIVHADLNSSFLRRPRDRRGRVTCIAKKGHRRFARHFVAKAHNIFKAKRKAIRKCRRASRLGDIFASRGGRCRIVDCYKDRRGNRGGRGGRIGPR